MAEMTTYDYILPMKQSRRLVFITYPGAFLLDFAGPSAVFTTASRLSAEPLYEVTVAAPGGGQIVHGCGTSVVTVDLSTVQIGPRDTVIVIGARAKALGVVMRDRAVLEAVVASSETAERCGSVCSGAFVLAAAGVLNGRCAATHWEGQEQLAAHFPQISVDADALYVIDGRLWTSAGVTTGIDMALAMLECDHGRELKSRVARQLVVYSHRPGHQSQFSDLLVAQVEADERFGGLIEWLSQRLLNQSLNGSVRVADMAAFMAMSERSFYRQFVAMFAQTPGKLYERLRLSVAKDLIEAGASTKQTASKIGFRSETAFRSAFRTRFGVPPGLHRRMHG